MKKKWKYLYFLIPIIILAIVLAIGIKNERSGYRKVNGGYLYRFQTEDYKTVYTEKFQEERDEKIEEIKKVRNYSFQNSLMIMNPYQTNTNSLYVYFKTSTPSKLRYTVHVDNSDIKDYTNTLYNDGENNLTTEHEYLLTGLIPDKVNHITLELINVDGDVIKTKSIDIQAGSLLSNKKVKLDKKDGKSKEKLANGLYAVLGNDSNKTYFLCLYDNDGVIRSEIPFTGYRADRLLFKDDLLYMSVGMNKIAAVNRLGQVERIYSLGNYEMHHDYVFGKDNTLLILVDEKGADTVEDLVLSLDLETGDVTTVIDLKDYFASYKKTTILPEKKDQLDWIHINAIQYDSEDQSVLLSSRETSTIIKMSNIYEEPKIDYLIGSEAFWKDTEYSDYLLTQVGDFTLQGGQHSITLEKDDSLEDGEYYIYFYNNNYGEATTNPDFNWVENYPGIGTKRKAEKGDNFKSQYYKYLINEDAGTFELVDSFDVDYSGIVSSVQDIDGNTVVDSGMTSTFTEYDKNHNLIAKFDVLNDTLIYRVYKYDFMNYWFTK